MTRSKIDFSRYALAASALGTIGVAATAKADFTSPYALNPPPNNTFSGAMAAGTFGDWTSSLTFVPTGGDSLTTNQPTSVGLSITATGMVPSTDNFDLVTLAAGTGNVSLDYTFSSTGFNTLTFGYLVDGMFTQLANATATSTATFSVAAGQTFGFRLVANYGSVGSVTISNFAAPVPEPSVAMLAASGAIGLLALRAARRRRAAKAA